MLKIFNTEQIKALDAFTIAQEPIASIDLMERACRAFVTLFTERFTTDSKIGVVCGTGNNGGDGLAIARLLSERGYHITVWIVRGSVPESTDFKRNFSRIGKIPAFDIVKNSDRDLFHDCSILIDAIFGSGLSRKVEGIYEQAITCINATKAIRVSVDVPSGMFADKHTDGLAVEADWTITFQAPKLGFLLPENNKFVRRWDKVEIGLSKEFVSETETSHFYLTRKSVKKKLRTRLEFSHKGTFGKSLIIAGSHGKMGACVLAAQAAMRSGLGLLTVHVPQCGYEIIQSTVPEATVSVDKNEKYFATLPDVADYTALGVGSGIAQQSETVKAFAALLENFRKPMVIDADGLNILASNRELLHRIPENSILTPHPGEFKRLVGDWKDDFHRLEMGKDFSKQTRSYLILKGAHTSIITPQGKVYFNSTGNPGMATGGSGDVLTGILTGLLSQSFDPLDASILGVYLHGFAGDIAAQEKGMYSLIASDLIGFLPDAFKRLML